MDNRYEKAKALRLKGYSYNEILKLLEIPKSTQSGWFKDLTLSQKAKEYWLKTTKLSITNFDKVLYVVSRSSQNKRPFNRLPYGTMQIRVSDTKKFYKLMGWISGLEGGLAHLM